MHKYPLYQIPNAVRLKIVPMLLLLAISGSILLWLDGWGGLTARATEIIIAQAGPFGEAHGGGPLPVWQQEGHEGEPLPCEDLLVNGGFEVFGGWQIASAAHPGIYSRARAASGAQSLKLGLDGTDQNVYSDSSAFQQVELPLDATQITLRAQLWQGSSAGDADTQSLSISVGDRTLTLFQEREDTRTWIPVSFDLTPFRGQTVRIQFSAFNTGAAGKSVLFVDDVRVLACRAGVTMHPSHVAAPVPPSDGGLGRGQPSQRAALTSTLGLHLPLVYRQEPPATPTPVPTEDANPCVEVLSNGGFETAEGWVLPATSFQARYTSEHALTGERSMRLGFPDDEPNIYSYSTAYRYIQLPSNVERLTLRAQVWRGSTPSDRDLHYLLILANGREYWLLRDLQDTRSWQSIEPYDLTPFAGKQIKITMGTYNNGTGGKAVMYVDDISIENCQSGQVSATPTTTPTATPIPVYAPPAEIKSPDFSVNAFLWWRPGIADRDLQLIEEAGFRWVRQSFSWEDIELSAGVFDWEEADRVVAQANARKLNLLARLSMNPDVTGFWAGKPPQSIDEFGAFVGALARRYNCTQQAVGCIQAYQIWNEPNLAREWGGNRPSPAHYVSMLKTAYTAIKGSNPNAIVISAGLAPTGTDNAIAMPDEKFYREMYRLMGGRSTGHFDMLGVHAPGFAAAPEVSPEEAAANSQYGGYRFFAFRHVEDIRNIMVSYGDTNTRIAILEFGWTSDAHNPDYIWFGSGAGIDEFVKADYLVRAYTYAAENWQPWIGIMSVLTMPNLDWIEDGDPYDEEQYWWAIMEPSTLDELRLRPAYVKLCDLFNGLQGEVCPYNPSGIRRID